MEIVDYSEKSFLVKGEKTKLFKEEFKKMNGSWNRTLGGWIFSKQHKEKLNSLINSPIEASSTTSISSHSQQQTSSSNKIFQLFINYLQQKNIKIYLTDLINFDFLNKQNDEDDKSSIDDDTEFELESDSNNKSEKNSFYFIFIDFFKEIKSEIDFSTYQNIDKLKLLEFAFINQ